MVFYLFSRMGRTYGSKSPGNYMPRWTPQIKRKQRISSSDSDETKESRLRSEMPAEGRDRGSLRTGSRFPAQSSKDGSSYEISYFESEPGKLYLEPYFSSKLFVLMLFATC